MKPSEVEIGMRFKDTERPRRGKYYTVARYYGDVNNDRRFDLVYDDRTILPACYASMIVADEFIGKTVVSVGGVPRSTLSEGEIWLAITTTGKVKQIQIAHVPQDKTNERVTGHEDGGPSAWSFNVDGVIYIKIAGAKPAEPERAKVVVAPNVPTCRAGGCKLPRVTLAGHCAPHELLHEVDISERMKAMEESHARLRSLYSTTPNPYAIRPVDDGRLRQSTNITGGLGVFSLRAPRRK
jgi:hypothetical protein